MKNQLSLFLRLTYIHQHAVICHHVFNFKRWIYTFWLRENVCVLKCLSRVASSTWIIQALGNSISLRDNKHNSFQSIYQTRFHLSRSRNVRMYYATLKIQFCYLWSKIRCEMSENWGKVLTHSTNWSFNRDR